MKKLLLSLAATCFLSACAFSGMHRGIEGMNIGYNNIEARPMEASVEVGKKITGKATCSNFLFFYSTPDNEAFGATLQNTSGNTSSLCTRGAVYNALKGSDADLLIAPKYEQQRSKSLCLPFIDACVYRSTTINVTGFEGRYKNIKEMDADTIKTLRIERAKHGDAPAPAAEKESWFESYLHVITLGLY